MFVDPWVIPCAAIAFFAFGFLLGRDSRGA